MAKKKDPLAALKAAFGDLVKEDIPAPLPDFSQYEKSLQRGSTLALVRSLPPISQTMITRSCANPDCQKPFRTTYIYDTYCSHSCLASQLKKSTGLEYNPVKDNWARYHDPIKTSPAALVAMEKFCREFLADLDRVRSSPPPQTPQESVAQAEAFLSSPAESPVAIPVLNDVVPEARPSLIEELDLDI